MLKRRIKTTFTALFVASFLFCLLLQTEYVKNFVKEQIKRKIEAETEYTVTIGDLQLSPAFKLYIANTVLLSGKKDAIKIKNGCFTLSPLALWEGYLHISSFSLNHLEIQQLPSKVFEARGSLTYDPRKAFALSSLEIYEENHSDSKLTASLVYHEGQGTLSISKQNGFRCEGSFSVSKEGNIGFTLNSNDLNISGLSLDGIAVRSTAKPSGEKFQGKFSISFTKLGQLYRTCGDLEGNRKAISLQTTINLTELMQLCAVDAANVEGK